MEDETAWNFENASTVQTSIGAWNVAVCRHCLDVALTTGKANMVWSCLRQGRLQIWIARASHVIDELTKLRCDRAFYMTQEE